VLGLGEAFVGWMVAYLGDSAAHGFIKSRRHEREVMAAVESALDDVAARAPSPTRDKLLWGLREVFSKPPRLRSTGREPIEVSLRRSIAAQVRLLEDYCSPESGNVFFDDVDVEPGWLSKEIFAALTDSLRQANASHDLDGLVQQLNFEDLGAQVCAFPA
jgi:hypothetical protein